MVLILALAGLPAGCKQKRSATPERTAVARGKAEAEQHEEKGVEQAPSTSRAPVEEMASEVTVTFDDRARVTGLQVEGVDVFSGEAAPFASLCDVTKGERFVPGVVAGGDPAGDLELGFKDMQAKATVKYEYADGALRFTCDLRGVPELPARGMLLRFAFPMDCRGWYWHDDMQTSRKIGGNQVFENVRALRAWADLPEWEDQPDLRMGYSDRNFCTVLTGPAGVCLAVPLDRPCIFRTAYDPQVRQLQIVYDFALSADTREPNAVSFSFALYACDPAWGFRSALSRYYELYPEMFEVHVKEPGMWMAFTRLSQIDNANEFCFGLQEGAPEPEYDDSIGVLDCTYFTHAGMGASIPDHDPEKDPLPPHDRLVEAVEAAFKRRTKTDGMFHRVGLFDVQDRLDVRKWRVYAHLIAQFNLDPELPYGRWHLERTAKQTEEKLRKRGGVLDGFYYDGLTSGLNYRTEHFRHSLAPPLWDPAARKPLLNNFFSASEFARAAAELLRPRGQITMMNGAIGASFYVTPWLDVLGSETGLRIKREALNYVRSTTYHKPYLTLLKGNYEQGIGYDEMELFMKRALAYGVLPGFFDWPPSGLGPGGRYWDHPEYYERDRSLFRRYLPLCQTLARAGWEPVTHARSSDGNVFVERFGPADDGIAWLTLLNEDKLPHTTTLTVDAKGLGVDPTDVRCIDILTDAPAHFKAEDGQLAAQIDVKADGVRLLQLCTPRQAVAWRLARALDTMDRGLAMRKVDAGKPPLAVHWHSHPGGKQYAREAYAGGYVMVMDGNRGRQLFWQWAMLFQPEPAPVTLRVRAAGEDLTGTPGIYCRLAWVTKSYTHYEKRFFTLPKGSYDFKEFDFTIECKDPLRAVYLEPQTAKGITGKLKIAAVTLADRFGDDHVVDPTFEQWYEPTPERMRGRLARECTAIRDAVARARQLIQKGKADTTTRDALLDIAGHCAKLREWIAGEKAENGCRRALRDIETTELHLAQAFVAAVGADPPQIVGPAEAAPGDKVTLRLLVPHVPDLPVAAVAGTGKELVEVGPEGWTITIPPDAEPKHKLRITGQVRIGAAARNVTVKASHVIEVARPLQMRLVNEGPDPRTGGFSLRARVRNNRVRAVTALLEVNVPPGWKARGAKRVNLPARGGADVSLLVTPLDNATPGLAEVVTTLTAGSDRTLASSVLFYVPARANLLRNPGFEQGQTAWARSGGTVGKTVTIDRQVFHSGGACVRIDNTNRSERSQISQSVKLDQEQPCAVLVRAVSRAQNVSGKKNRKEYSLYVDIYYTDGTPLYGRTHGFETGTTDWQVGELCIEPAKPIRNVNVYLLLRGKSGTAWFDDVAVMEDPRRRGNIAREAEVVVDGSHSGYSAGPITDGIVHVAKDAHWSAESWASEESAKDHFIELRFAESRKVGRAVLYWSLDGGIPRTSAQVQVCIPEGNAWRTVATAKPAEPAPVTVITFKAPAASRIFRIVQPKGRGPTGRPDLMWVREAELLAPQ